MTTDPSRGPDPERDATAPVPPFGAADPLPPLGSLRHCLIRDRHPLRKLHGDLSRQARDGGNLDPKRLEELRERLRRSQESVARRRAAIPALNFPEELPITARRDDIAASLRQHPVTIVRGATGSGKTTQLPKICLALGLGCAGMIGVTQPRRIAARSIAEFLRQDLNDPDRLIGHKVRFNDHTNPDTLVKIMTDGILLAEIQGDRLLTRYEAIIVDEAHERSLNIDFLLGLLRQILPKRPEFKLIISSATLDAEKFSHHFGAAPIIDVSGRTYPVETRYRPRVVQADEENDLEEAEEQSLEQAIQAAVAELSRPGMHGDILVFLPGEQQIREIGEVLDKRLPLGTEILPLFARLPGADQQRIFQTGAQRRIILATNVAETSITVPGVRYVIDSGLVRISRISERSRIQRLPVEKNSRASADQRQGRCGRVADGICIRLYSEEEYLARPQFTDPEILRTPLDAVILQMKAMRIGEIDSFPFVDPPPNRAISQGMRFLEEIGALDDAGHLTEIGKQLAQLPVPPGLGRILLEGGKRGRLREILVLVSALCIPDPREEPLERRDAARQAHARHKDPNSDFSGLLNLWRFIQQGRLDHPSNNGFRKFLKENFLSRVRVREWLEIHAQLEAMCLELGLKPNETEATQAEIHQALLPGLLGNIGFKQDHREFAGARESRFWIHPGSALHRKAPTWVVAAELVETSRLYARTCARVEPEWIEAAAGHLCRRAYLNAHWEKQLGQVMAQERVTLFGLVLLANRKVHFGPLNPVEARQIFIQSALVEGAFNSSAPFFVHNQAMIAEVRELEHKTRRRDLLTPDPERYAFYDERIPASLHASRRFHEWYAEARKKNPRLLYFERDHVLRRDDGSIQGERFPGHLIIDGREYPLEYTFDPGGHNDGVNVRIPISLLNLLSPLPFEWLVPGVLPDKILALLKSLPKGLRKPLVPLPQTVEWCMERLGYGKSSLKVTLIQLLKARSPLDIPLESFREDSLPDHLRMNFLIVDESGTRTLGRGRDLEALKSELCENARERLVKQPKTEWERTGITRWDFGAIPEQVILDAGGIRLHGTPVLQDDGESVSLRLMNDPMRAIETTRGGLARLFMLHLASVLQGLRRNQPLSKEASMAFLTLTMGKPGPHVTVIDQAIQRAIRHLFLPSEGSIIRGPDEFQLRLQSGRARLVPEVQAGVNQAQKILDGYVAVRQGIRQAPPQVLKEAVPDIQAQLTHLLPPDFLNTVPSPWLERLPVYLKAIQIRLERCARDPLKDSRAIGEILPFWREYQKRAERHAREGLTDPELIQLRWMIEEWRVSLFAQELGTALPVSTKRLAAQLHKSIA
ncbi:MAG: ATP-dependent RNA helicase HrpA [Magnetococcales bacterium]|nr:ATP-dependent RNA helicase HrpA [Magnetococcales bacterium]